MCWCTLNTKHPTSDIDLLEDRIKTTKKKNKKSIQLSNTFHFHCTWFILLIFVLLCKKGISQWSQNRTSIPLRKYNWQSAQHMVQLIHGNCSSLYKTISSACTVWLANIFSLSFFLVSYVRGEVIAMNWILCRLL